MAPPNRRNPGQRGTKDRPDVFSNPSTQGKAGPPGSPSAVGRENEARETHHSDDYNSQDDGKEEEEEEKKKVEDKAEDKADWHWQCHLCAHLNALPPLYRDFSAVPPCISQPCGNADVPLPEPSYGPLRLRGPEPRSWEGRMRSGRNGGGGGSGDGGGGGGGGSGGSEAWKSAYQKLLEAEDSDGVEGSFTGVGTGVGTGVSISKSTSTSKRTNTYTTAPPPSTHCPHRRCEGCYDVDAGAHVVRFCGGGTGGGGGGSGSSRSEVPARLYAQWRAGFGFVEPGFDPPVVDGGLGRARGEAFGETWCQTQTQTRNQNRNQTRSEGVGFIGVGGAECGDEGSFIRGGGRVEKGEDGIGDGNGSESGNGAATEMQRPTDEPARTQVQPPRTRSPVRYVAGESRILLVRSAGGRSSDNDDDDDGGGENSQEDKAGKASSDEGEGFFGEHGNGDHNVGEGSSSDGGSHGWVEPITFVHRGSQEGGGCSESDSESDGERGGEREGEREGEKGGSGADVEEEEGGKEDKEHDGEEEEE